MAENSAVWGGSVSPNPILRIHLAYSSYSQGGNYSSWYWFVRYEQNNSSSWQAGSSNWVNVIGFATADAVYFAVPASWAYTWNTKYPYGGPGYFNKGHNEAGYLAAGVMGTNGYFNNSPYTTTAYTQVSSGTPPRIPKVPSVPPAPVFVSAEADSLTFNIQAPSDNGGSTITSYDMQVLTETTGPDELVGGWADGASAQTTPASIPLAPATKYRVRYRAKNSIGVSGWSPTTMMTTEAGFYVSDGTAWVGTRFLVSDGTDWLNSDALISNGTAWVPPVAP